MQELKVTPARFAERTATIAVVGLGKIGLPLATYYTRSGHHVTGCDINPLIVEMINAKRSPMQEEAWLESELSPAVESGALTVTVDTTQAVRQSDVVVVIVPVLTTDAHDVDFHAIDAATMSVGMGLQPGTLVIFETTLPVGTTANRLRLLLEHSSHLIAGRDFHLAYSPERVSSGRIARDLETYPKVIGGFDEASLAAATAFYRSVLDVEIIQMGSTDQAEFVKLIETTYRDVNIALANEYARYADARGLDLWAAIAAANTQPYSHIHQPGVGVGGHCIPVYPYFLLHDGAEELSLPRRARVVNDDMAMYGVERIQQVTGSLSGRSVLILGAAYRGDVREPAYSSARLLHEALTAQGAKVYVSDPLFTDGELEAMGYTPFKPEEREEIIAVVLQTDHRAFRDFDFGLFPHCQVVLDGRGALRREQIEALGMQYLRIGGGMKPVAMSGLRGQ